MEEGSDSATIRLACLDCQAPSSGEKVGNKGLAAEGTDLAWCTCTGGSLGRASWSSGASQMT